MHVCEMKTKWWTLKHLASYCQLLDIYVKNIHWNLSIFKYPVYPTWLLFPNLLTYLCKNNHFKLESPLTKHFAWSQKVPVYRDFTAVCLCFFLNLYIYLCFLQYLSVSILNPISCMIMVVNRAFSIQVDLVCVYLQMKPY